MSASVRKADSVTSLSSVDDSNFAFDTRKRIYFIDIIYADTTAKLSTALVGTHISYSFSRHALPRASYYIQLAVAPMVLMACDSQSRKQVETTNDSPSRHPRSYQSMSCPCPLSFQERLKRRTIPKELIFIRDINQIHNPPSFR